MSANYKYATVLEAIKQLRLDGFTVDFNLEKMPFRQIQENTIRTILRLRKFTAMRAIQVRMKRQRFTESNPTTGQRGYWLLPTECTSMKFLKIC